MTYRRLLILITASILIFTSPTCSEIIISSTPLSDFTLQWTHLSSENGDLPPPSNSVEQTASLILDVNKDGLNDFVIGIRQAPAPSMVWYKRSTNGWTKYLIDDTVLGIEAGGAFYDIDRDGDFDIVMGGDFQSNKVWWWENPYPNYDTNTSWTRREIKNSGNNIHHDQIFGDFDGDGQVELVFWNQAQWNPNNPDAKLFIAEIPVAPKTTEPWTYTEIYSGFGEGLAQADMDGDGQIDIVGGGRWFKHTGDTSYTANIINDAQKFTRVAVGQLKSGGRPEVVFVAGDEAGPLEWYEWTGSAWQGHNLLGANVDHGHSLDLVDMDGDGNLDIFVAEMRLNGGNSDAKMWIFFGDGNGNFALTEVTTGFGNHESRVGDLDGDGDLDILGKPFNWETPRLDIWMNQMCERPLDQWERHVIDATKPWQTIFITSVDIDGDNKKDIITGGWWYKNPGNPNGTWIRNTIGSPLNNMAVVYDFDGDNNMDILGTQGQASIGSVPNSDSFVWAHNNGSGSFSILNNIEDGDGDFLQGVVVDHFLGNDFVEVALSWHEAGKGVQKLTIPTNPLTQIWTHNQLFPISQDEGLNSGDIDRDGDIDLLLGTKWLENEGASWNEHVLHNTNGAPAGEKDPDRNRLVDINRDGRLDAVVGFEAINMQGKLAWYKQGSDATSIWVEQVIAATVVGPMSLDVADMDKDGDSDIVVGEHNLATPANAKLYVFENSDGQGNSWIEHIVYTGDEHHDGAQVVDIDGDDDLDIISIGWGHDQVLLYENKSLNCIRPQIWIPVTLIK